MPRDTELGGMTNFGLSADTQSSRLGEPTISLEDLIGSPTSILSERARYNLIRERLGEMQRTEPAGLLARFLSPGGLLAIGTAATAALAGGEEGQAAGAGLLLGAINKARYLQELEQSQKQKAMNEIADQAEDSLNRQVKLQQQLQTFLAQRPEAAINPLTGEQYVDEKVLGNLMFGLKDFPIRMRDPQRDEEWERLWDFAENTLKQTTDPGARSTIVNYMLKDMLGGHRVPDNVIQSIASAANADEAEQRIFDMIMDHGDHETWNAYIWALTNGYGLLDKEFLTKIHFSDEGDPNIPNSQKINGTTLDCYDQIRKWANENPEEYDAIWANYGNDYTAINREVAARALKDYPKLFTHYMQKIDIRDPMDIALNQKAFNAIWGSIDLIKFMAATKLLDRPELQTLTGLFDFTWNRAREFTTKMKKDARKSAAIDYLTTTDNTKKALIERAKLSDNEAYRTARKIHREADTRARREDGSLDRALYEEITAQELEKAIAQIRAKKAQ